MRTILLRSAASSSAWLPGRPMSAEEAHRIGLINEIVAPDRLLPRAEELARMSIIDIGERKGLEADLRRAALEWRQTFDGLPLGVLVVDGDGMVVEALPDVVDRVIAGRTARARLVDSFETAFRAGDGRAVARVLAGQRQILFLDEPIEATFSAPEAATIRKMANTWGMPQTTWLDMPVT